MGNKVPLPEVREKCNGIASSRERSISHILLKGTLPEKEVEKQYRRNVYMQLSRRRPQRRGFSVSLVK